MRLHPPARSARLLVASLMAVSAAACGRRGVTPPAPGSLVLSIGRPVGPVRVLPAPEALELTAGGVGDPRSPGVRLVIPRSPAGDPRDLCLATVASGRALGEANASCDVRSPGVAAVFVAPLAPTRTRPAPTIVAGIAPPDIARIEVEGPGGRRMLPLSAHRAFLALYAGGLRGPVAVIADRVGGGASVRSFSLPLSPRLTRFPGVRHRRPGAVFADEIGENILQRSESGIRRRFGPPAAVEIEHGQRCAYYAVVGQGPRGWRLCFAADGRMTGASGNERLPA